MAERAETLSASLRFNPQWLVDPAWWFTQELGPEIRQQAAEIQLELARATLTAQVQAVEKMQAVVGRARQG